MFSKVNIVLGLLAVAGLAVAVYAVLQVGKIKAIPSITTAWNDKYPDNKLS